MQDLKKLKEDFDGLREFLVAVGHEKRQAIILALLEDKACEGLRVNDLTEVTQLSRPAISHHLKILKDAHVVDYSRVGTKNYYFLSHDLVEIDKMEMFINDIKEVIRKRDKK